MIGNLVPFHNNEDLKEWELYDYELTHGGRSCQMCGHTIHHIFRIRKWDSGKYQYSELGSDCVKKIAAANHVNSMNGLSNIPKRHRSRVKINKKEVDFNIDELPF
ncbi:hypothetical protein [Paenibacillus periandrae]|uniref:hypothetical protein n=1 Tax=Paenibacillus periandrae TaxID=1761741 RepID=UPI001F094075|nr:hypothetical protein [Paenibacillus periandrae]